MGVNRKSRLRSIAAGFVALFLLAATSRVWSEDGLEYEIRANPVGVGDRIYVNIFVDHPDPEAVSVTEPPLPKEVRVTSGPKISRVAVDGIFKTRISYQMRGEETGRYIIKPFIVLADGNALETDTRILEIGRYRNRSLYIPLQVEWQVPDGAVFTGQSIPVSLQLMSQLEIALIESYQIAYPKGAFFEEILGLSEIVSIPADEQQLYNIPVASFMFTPSQSGRLFLPAAEVHALGEKTESPVVRIDVRQLPAEARETGGVGSFTFRADLEGSRYEFGAVGTLLLNIEGVGNLNYLNVPQPAFGDLVQTDMVESSNVWPGARGYEGQRKVEYRFISDSAGVFSIVVPDFVYFDPLRETVRTAYGSSFRVTFDPPVEEVTSNESDFPFSMPTAADILIARRWGAYRVPFNYLWLLPAPIAFLILLVLKRTRILFVATVFVLLGAGDVVENPCPDLAPAVDAYLTGNYDDAHDGFLACIAELPGNPKLELALALTEYQMGSHDDAMYFARMAVRSDPMFVDARAFLTWLNESLELEKLVQPSAKVHPDVFFYGMVGFFSLGFLAAAVYLVKRNGAFVVFFLLGVLLSVACGGALAYTAAFNAKPAAIVYGRSAEVRKIPSNTASQWIELPVAYSLRVLGESGEFYLVRTAYGLTGWIEKNCLVLDRI
jgi:hypothetical protein